MRDFTKNTTNTLLFSVGATGALLSGAAAITWSAWILIDSVSTSQSTRNNLFSFMVDLGGNFGLRANIDGLTTPAEQHLLFRAQSQGADSVQSLTHTTNLPLATLYHVAGCADFAADMMYVWVNGAEESAAKTFGASAYTLGAPGDSDTIGNDETPTNQDAFDGAIGELAFWTRKLAADEVTALALGASPWLIDRPAIYLPLTGVDSPERDYVANLEGTIVGSLPRRAEEPPVIPIEYWQAQTGGHLTGAEVPGAIKAYNLRRMAA